MCARQPHALTSLAYARTAISDRTNGSERLHMPLWRMYRDSCYKARLAAEPPSACTTNSTSFQTGESQGGCCDEGTHAALRELVGDLAPGRVGNRVAGCRRSPVDFREPSGVICQPDEDGLRRG